MSLTRPNSVLLVSSLFVLLPVTCVYAQKGPHAGMGRPGMARPTKPEKPEKSAAPKREAAKGEAPKPAAGPQKVEQLSQLTPDQRQKALASLPPARRAQLEESLARYQSMTPAQRQNVAARAEKLQALPPDEQKQVRQSMQAAKQLPDDRQTAIRQELAQVRKLNPQQREARMNSSDFKSKFSPAEQDMVRHMGEVLPDPQF